ncbi:sulfurtransferase complex subunit TusC [Parashewanella spongiae]|uniref:Sulfurtransferase complex subunit TusC n=1 Tax=Parashewanella spongiae TaxID=342950 RepID=A0A3A6TXM2_9GAMM|nr:sulfurtransferase complex subunit TusC [Parashewanella spongiae]MCL1076865.1 sulfurtransferase complex subunit TusC [Parashewanella spongiae]RJY19232.1 sulfurtransferase complex subunit TusC [Parashewanella spongiae]
MKQLTIIFRHGPTAHSKGREALDLAMLSASFDQHVKLIFIDEGVFNTLKDQQIEQTGAKDYISTFKALSLYDIDDVYICKTSMDGFGLLSSDILIDYTSAEPSVISEMIRGSDKVLIF